MQGSVRRRGHAKMPVAKKFHAETQSRRESVPHPIPSWPGTDPAIHLCVLQTLVMLRCEPRNRI
ncbi:hypothetical protein GCM10008941_09090 [Rhizomicrobium palustre]